MRSPIVAKYDLRLDIAEPTVQHSGDTLDILGRPEPFVR